MGKITLEQAALWCGGSIDPKYKEVTFFGANNDTRKLREGELFVVLKGVRDGHEFIPAAMEKGAAAVLCNHCEGDYPAIVVEDVRIALGKIAAAYRKSLSIKVVGITGSVGKSTTKEMVASVLEGTYRVGKTPVNHNNDIGMPMAVLALPEDTEVAVLEMGMNHFREIAYLTNIAKPDIGVIINVGTMHIEHLGSREGILKAKMEILEGMGENSKLFLNGDNDLLWTQKDHPCHPVFFGWENEESSLRAENVEFTDGIRFQAVCAEKRFPVELPLEGAHYVCDAMAAVAVGLELGVAPEDISRRLYEFQNMEGRQEIYKAGELTIIKDCYNAGPESMAASLAVLKGKPGRRIAVLGDMLELGDRSAEEHHKVGALCATCADVLLAYGPESGNTCRGALEAGMKEENAKAFTDRDSLAKYLKEIAKPGDVLLFKGSRGMRMELALDAFLKEER